MNMPSIPDGSGRHPLVLVALAANNLNASVAFYQKLFGWQMQPIAPDIIWASPAAASGPNIVFRANTPAGFPGTVPFIQVDDVDAALSRVVAVGASVERAPWMVPMAGKLARFADACGTIYGLIGATADTPTLVPMPFGTNPKPPAGTICSFEMYAASGTAAAAFFSAQFGWGTMETMPQYMGFNPGAGVGGVFQSHTPSLPAVAYIYVADVPSTMTAIDAAGGERSGEPMAIPGMGTFGYFKDPSGTSVGLIGP